MERVQHRHGYSVEMVILPVDDVRRHIVVVRIMFAVPLAVEQELVPAAEGKGGADFFRYGFYCYNYLIMILLPHQLREIRW